MTHRMGNQRQISILNFLKCIINKLYNDSIQSQSDFFYARIILKYKKVFNWCRKKKKEKPCRVFLSEHFFKAVHLRRMLTLATKF